MNNVKGRCNELVGFSSGKDARARRMSCSIFAILATTSFGFEAASAQGLGVDEVVVTARRVEENQQEVPITVNAFTGAALKARGLTNITQVGDFTPGLTIDFTSPISGSTASASTFIRGVGQSDFLLTIDPGVGIYVDGVYIARSVGGVVDLLNVERIEVLKGPQGTLFGRNTIGGAINITSREPGDEFFAEAEFTAGRFNRKDIRIAADVPLAENWALSLAFSSKNRDGYARRIPFTGPQNGDIQLVGPNPDVFALTGNPFLNQAAVNSSELGNENTDTGRAALYYRPTDRFKARLAIDYTRTRENGPASTLLSTSAPVALNGAGQADPSVVIPQPFGPDSLQTLANTIVAATPGLAGTVTPYDDRFITGDPDTTFATGPNFSNLDLWGASLTIDYALTDTIDLQIISAYRDLEASFGRDGDSSPLIVDHTSNIYNHQQFTQEIKLSGASFDNFMKWTGGFYFFREEGDDNVFVPLGSIGLSNPPLLQLDELNQVQNRSIAVFGETSIFLTSKLSLTGGLRFTDENKRYDPIHQDFGQFFGAGPNGLNADGTATILLPLGEVSQGFSDLSFRAGVEYRASDAVFVYATASSGFKSGGFTGRTVDPQTAVRPFAEENLLQYEIGFKTDLADGFRFNTAAFFSDYSDIQIVAQEAITPITVNAAAAEIYGIETEFQWQVSEPFFITGNAAWTEAGYTEIDDTQFLTSALNVNSEFANTPKWKASMAAEYEVPVSAGVFRIRGDWTYTSDIFNNAENTPELVEPDLHLFNAGVTFEHKSQNWDIVAGGRNLSNQRYIVSGFDQPGVGFTEATFSRPREWFVTFRYRY